MKTFSALLTVAAVAAALVLPIGLIATISVLFGAGLAAILHADYGQRMQPLHMRAAGAAALAAARTERFGLAA